MITIKPSDRKLTRTQAYQLVHKLAEADAPEDLRELLLYFAPGIPAKPKDSEQWLSKFVSDKKDLRIQLNYLYSNGERLCATDGMTLAWSDTKLPEGYYEPKTMWPVGINTRYPDIDRLIPEETSRPYLLTLDELNIVSTGFARESFVYEIQDLYFLKTQIDHIACAGETTVQVLAKDQNVLRGQTPLGEFVTMRIEL